MADVIAPPSIAEIAGGYHFGYRAFGDPAGHPVLALHGTPATSRMFAVADAQARAAGLRLIAPDRPGYGATPLDVRPTLASRAAELAALADAIGLDRFSILGVSGGGPYAIALAALLQQRIEALALVAPVGPFADEDLSPRLSRTAHAVFIGLPRQHPRVMELLTGITATGFRWMPNLVGRFVATMAGHADSAILHRPEIESAMLAMIREALSHGTEGPLADADIYSLPWQLDFSAISARTTIWQGTADRIVPPQSAEVLAMLIPDAKLNRIDGAGHFWVFEHIADVLAELRQTARVLASN